jgi:hypothetical protein
VTAPRHRHLALPTGLTYHCLEWGQAAAGDGLGPEAGRRTVVLVHGFLDLAWGLGRGRDPAWPSATT